MYDCVLDRFFQWPSLPNDFLLKRVAEPNAQRAQKNRRQELALADANVKQVFLIVFELDPRTAVRNDLRDEHRAAFEEDARASDATAKR